MSAEERDDHSRNDIEYALGRLLPKPVPPGLRERVIGSAFQTRKNSVLTPQLRIVAVTCSILLVAVLLLEPLSSRWEAARLAALLDGRPASPATGEEAAEFAEVLGLRGREADRMAKLQAMTAPALRKERMGDFIEAQKRLKGWLENETSEDIN